MKRDFVTRAEPLPRPGPCPFCAGVAVRLMSDVPSGGWFVQCKRLRCRATGPLMDGQAAAVEAWNSRECCGGTADE